MINNTTTTTTNAPRSLLHAANGIVKWENFLKYYFREILPVNAV